MMLHPTLKQLLRGTMLLSMLLPTKAKLAIVRVFASADEVNDMNQIFSQWNTVPPCHSQPSVPVDLLLVYSQRFQDNAAASQAANEVVTSVTSGTAAWSQCFATAQSFDAQLTAHEDVYDSRGYAARRDWANGPNSVFMYVMRSFNDGTFGSYHAFYFMEFDAVPVRPNWLDVLVQEAYDSGMAVRGSRFRGDTWDAFLPQLPEDVLFHLNGNAIYNLTHPWLVSMAQTLQQELDAGTLSTAFDVRMAQLTLAEYAKDLGKAPYKADSILIGNYAQTLLNSSFEAAEFIRHASMSNIFENMEESKITLGVLGTSDLSTFMASLSSLHPFRKVMIARDTPNIPETEFVLSVGGDVEVSSFTLQNHWVTARCEIADKVTTEFVMFTDSLNVLASPVYILVDSSGHPLLPYTPADGSYCTRSAGCMSELEEAEQLFGVRLNYHHNTHETVFNTAQFQRYCSAFDLATGSLASYQDCGIVNGITADGFIAWLISMSSSEPFNYVPRNKQRFGSRSWGLPIAAHPVDTRTCSVYTQEQAFLVEGNITTCPLIIEDPVRCESTVNCTWRPLFGSGRCVNTPFQVSFDFFRSPSMTTTTTQTATRTSTVMTTTVTATTVTFTVKVACTEGLPQGFETSSCANLISGQSCTVSCQFPLQGSSQYFCNQDGVFEGEAPMCASRSCTFAEEIPTLYESAACVDTVAGGFCFVKCSAGYEGVESLYTCGSDWVLRGTLPQCQRIECYIGSLPESIGANYTDCLTNSAGLPVGMGETCQVACDFGFTGASQNMTCLESGNFQGSAVTCTRTQCSKTWSDSSILLNCRQGATTTAEHGDACVTLCDTGYVGASTELTCVNGAFEGNLATCVPAVCSWQAFALVSNVDNTDCNGKNLGETCQLACESGFSAVGSPTVTCQSDNFFSQPQLTCEPLSCGDLSTVAGFPPSSVGHSCDNSIFSDTCSVYCLDGYQISGSEPQLQCSGGTTNAGFTQVDGTALQPPTCVPQPCTGGFPTMRGATDNCSGVVTGQSCTVTAEPGYQATPNNAVLECQADGFLTGTMPVVQPATCPDGTFGTGIGSTCQNKVVNAECWAYCLTDYEGDVKLYQCQVASTGLPELSAVSGEIACTYNGTRRLESKDDVQDDGNTANDASESSRRLAASCDSNSVQAFGLNSAQFTHSCASLAHDEVCISHCSFGWEMTSSPSVLVCTSGTLEGSTLPTCQPVQCNYSWPGPKVDHDCEGKATLETCTGQCQTGYTGAATTIQCEASGNFQQNDPTCEPVKCEVQLAAHLTSDCVNITLGKSCTVDCAEGYNLVGGVSRLRCGSDGNFIGNLPTCTAVQCANTVPTDPAFDNAPCDNLVYGQSCSVTCNPGFSPNTTTLACNSRGALTGTLPLCSPVPCDGSHLNRPELLNTCDNIFYGQNCSTFCARGFEASAGTGLEQLSCTISTGNTIELVGSLPSCTARPCTLGLPLASDRATDNCSALTYQERCVQQCVEGYTGNTPNFLCGSDGAAERDVTSLCRPEICNTEALSVVSHNCENVSFGESCYAYCPPGYVADQPAVRLQCLGSTSTEPAISPNESRRLALDEAVNIGFNFELPTFNVTALKDTLQLTFERDHIPVIQAALQNTGLPSLSNVRILAFNLTLSSGGALSDINVAFTVEEVSADPWRYPNWAVMLILVLSVTAFICIVIAVIALCQRRRKKSPPPESDTVGVEANKVTTEKPAEEPQDGGDEMPPASVRISVEEDTNSPEPPRTNPTGEAHDARGMLKDSGVLFETEKPAEDNSSEMVVTDFGRAEKMQEAHL